MRWIRSAGGPLLLLEERNLDKWGGVADVIEGSPAEASWSPGGQPTDYDRACRVDGYLGKIAVGVEEAVVLGDAPMDTTWVRSEATDGGMLVRWLFGESEDDVLSYVKVTPDAIFQPDDRLSVREGKLLLFDSAFAGRNVKKHPDEYLTIELKRGVYQIETAIFEPDDLAFLVIHRLEPSSAV